MIANVAMIPVERLRLSPLNPRKSFDVGGLSELARSIEQSGVQVPLLVRPVFEPDLEAEYEIVAGHRRCEAAKMAGCAELPCIVREMADDEAREVMLVENLQRADLPPLDEADAYEGLLPSLGSVASVAARVGKPIEYVTRRLKLRTLTPLSRRALAETLITLDHALLLSKLAAKEQDEMLKWTLDHSAGVKVSCEKALDEALSRRKRRTGGWYGYWQPRSVLELKQHIERETKLLLAKAPWDLHDAELLPAAGACTECPKNTAHNEALFGDLAITKASCTDSQCFDAKRAAFVQIQLNAVTGAGAQAVRISWKPSSAAPRKADFVEGSVAEAAFLGQVFKSGQWVEAKKGSCAHVKTGVAIDYGDDSKNKPGAKLLVCVAPGCKAHPKAWEKPAGKDDRNQNSEANKAKREAAAELVKAENAIRAGLVKQAIAKVTKLSGELLRRVVLRALPSWGLDGEEAEMFPGLKEGLETLKVDSAEFARAAACLLFLSDEHMGDSVFAGTHGKPEDGRKEFIALLKVLGVDASSAWAKPAAGQAKAGQSNAAAAKNKKAKPKTRTAAAAKKRQGKAAGK